MKNFALGLSALLVSLIWAPEAAAHALTCKNTWGYVYFTENAAMAKKCQNNYDDGCNWKSNALNCKWDPGSGKKEQNAKEEEKPKAAPTPPPAVPGPPPPPKLTLNLNLNLNKKEEEEPKKEEPKKETPKAEEPKKTEVVKAEETLIEKPAVEPMPKDDLEQAKKEAKLASAKVEELKITMEEIKVNNQNNAILYRSPDANMGSVDPRFNAFSAGLSGSFGSSGAGGLLGSALKNRAGKGSKEMSGRGLASAGNGETSIASEGDKSGASTKGDSASATSDNPWVNYMGQTSKAGLIDRLRKNPNLRDSLRDRIAELQAKGDQSGVVVLMEEALEAAEKESQGPNLDNLKPMALMEAFSMDSAETEAQIRGLLADLDMESDPQFLPQISLFERISVAHRRSLVRGALKTAQ